ncbi:MAG TPA: hypothetical protein VMS93_11085, partial [Candidatus Saccharimonadales bacterium]|nr:hypothetical protein [Candidatus Saccharimonadales bacterium]
RGPGDSPSAVARLRDIENFGAQRVVLIDHEGQQPLLAYNPGSNNARAWCEAQARVSDEVLGHAPRVVEDARYLMRQTSGLAMLAEFGPGGGGPAALAGQAARVRREALALYEGLVSSLAGPGRGMGRMRFVFGHEWARAVLRVDETLLLDLDREATATLPVVAPGSHRLEADLDGEASWAVVDVDSTGTRRVSDSHLRRYVERPSPSAGLPDLIFHQRYPEEISTRTQPMRTGVRETAGPR